MNEQYIKTLFFDFYTLNLLNYFAGKNSLNYFNRSEKIHNLYEEKTDELYRLIRKAVEYSTMREFRHYNDWCQGNKKYLKELSSKMMNLYCDDYLDSFLQNNKSDHFTLGFSDLEYNTLFQKIHIGFSDKTWDKYYGGKNWAKATEFLLQTPKTLRQKELWIDRVLDLQHNCGHLLNKTPFVILSRRKQVTNQKDKRTKRIILNYRRYATKISDLTLFSSNFVKKLTIANSNFIPEAIR